MAIGFKKNKFTGIKTIALILLGLLFLTSAKKYSPKAEHSYIDLKPISGYGSVYAGDAVKVGKIVDSLPPLSDFYDQKYISLDTEKEPYGLNVFYEYNNRSDGINNIFMTSCAENNALILFTFVENLEYVNFVFRNTPSDGCLEVSQYAGKYSYLRQDFEEAYGSLDSLRNDLWQFQDILNQNHFIDFSFMHYNRISLGDESDWVLYRNGNPDFVYTYENMASMIYNNLDGTTLDIELDINENVKKIQIRGNSEILLNCNIEKGTYEEVIKNLGKPASEVKNGNLTKLIYTIKGTEDRAVFFRFYNGLLESHGMEILS